MKLYSGLNVNSLKKMYKFCNLLVFPLYSEDKLEYNREQNS